MHAALRAVVKEILLQPHGHDWSFQGFGFLRLYFGRKYRLHVWDQRAANPGVSTIHDHLQWHFKSHILAGCVTNYRFTVDESCITGRLHRMQTLRTGPGGGLLPGASKLVGLTRGAPEVYHVGDEYSQRNDEVHESQPLDGTVTLIERTHTDAEELARVFWPEGGEWVSAEPRAATVEEVSAITAKALEWFV